MASTGYLSQYAGKTKTTSRVAGTGFLSQYSNYNSPENIAKRKKLQEEQKRNIEEQQKSAFQKQTMPIQSTATGKDLTYNQTQNAFITAQRPTYKSQQLQGQGQPIVTQNPQVQLNEEQQKADTRIADSVLSNPKTTEEKKSLALKVKKLNDQIDQGKKAGIEVEGGVILNSIKDIAKSVTGVLGIDKSSQSTLDISRRYTSKDSELAGLQAEYSALKEKQKLVNPNSGFVDFVNSALNSAEYGIEFAATKAGKAGAPLFIIGSGVNDITKRNTDLVGYDQKTNSYYIKENNVKQYQERVENPKELAKDLTVSISNQALQYIVEEKLGQITEKLIGTLAKPLLKNPVVSAGTSKILSTNLGKFFQKIGSTQFGNTGKSILDISKTVKGLAGIQGFTGEQAEEEVQYILDKIANNIIDETDDKLSLMSNQERLMSILTIGVMQLAPIGATKVVNEAYKKIANNQTQKALIDGGISKEQAKILAPLITDKAMAANEEISQQPQPETQVEVTKTPQNQVLPEQTNVVTQEQKKEEIKPVEEAKSEEELAREYIKSRATKLREDRKYDISWTDKKGKKHKLEDVEYADAQGWVSNLEKQGISPNVSKVSETKYRVEDQEDENLKNLSPESVSPIKTGGVGGVEKDLQQIKKLNNWSGVPADESLTMPMDKLKKLEEQGKKELSHITSADKAKIFFRSSDRPDFNDRADAGIFFSNQYGHSKLYAGSLMETKPSKMQIVTLDVKNPYYATKDEIEYHFGQRDKWVTELKKQGYDGISEVASKNPNDMGFDIIPDEVAVFDKSQVKVINIIDNPEGRNLSDEKVFERIKSALTQSQPIKTGGDELINEAKKYKSAEEFVQNTPKSKGVDTIGRPIPDWRDQIVYHSTDVKSANNIANKGWKIFGNDNQMGYYGNAISVTPQLKYTKQFGDKLTINKIDKSAKILNLNDEKDWEIFEKITENLDVKKFREKIVSAGYDGIYDPGAGDLFIYNPSKLKNISVVDNKTYNPADIWNKAKYRLEDNTLEEEAKKYKSAEEFIKAQGTPVYHGTPEKFDNFSLEHVGKSTDSGMFGKGIYFTDDLKEAKTYSKRGDKVGEVKEVILDLKKPYIIKTKADIPKIDVPNETIEQMSVAAKEYSRLFTEKLQKEGYDGVIDMMSPGSKQYVVFNPSQIKTKSQLEDIWNKANKEKYRLKDDFQKATGIDLTDSQEQKIIDLNKKFFGDDDVKITAQILTPSGKKALGSYRDGIIKILGGKADATDTYLHEAVHKYFDIFLTEDEQVNLLLAAKKEFGGKDFAEVEENLAENFIEYAKKKDLDNKEIKTIFDKIISRIKKYFANEKEITKFYNDIIEGKAKKVKEKVATPKLSERKIEEFSQTIKKTQPQLSSKMREEVAQYAYDLAQGTGKGVNDGYLIYDENDRVTGRVGWTSNNDVWYQEWFKEYKRPPSLTEITQKALDDLKQGQPEEYYDKEYLSTVAGQNFTKEIKETTVKKGTLPVKGTGEVKASKLEARLKGLSDKVKNLSEEEANDLGVGMYEALKNKDQLIKAGEFVKNNPQEALDVITGKKETPKDLLTNAIFVAYTEYAKEQADSGNYEPLLRSASLQATRMGQELQILSKIDPNNPVAIANQVYEIRVKEIQEKNGQNYRKQVDKETAKAKKEVNKESKSDWAKFIDSIKC